MIVNFIDLFTNGEGDSGAYRDMRTCPLLNITTDIKGMISKKSKPINICGENRKTEMLSDRISPWNSKQDEFVGKYHAPEIVFGI